MRKEAESRQIKEIKKIYNSVKEDIQSRLDDFSRLWENGDEKDIFAELVFCILTPQSKAKNCWNAVKKIVSKNMLLHGDKKQIIKELHGVRFRYKKAEYIIKARKHFLMNNKLSVRSKIQQFKNPYLTREWLVKNIAGFGYKEASHFLRNIGMGEDFAILDRHILKNLRRLDVIRCVPKSLSRNIYLDIEKRMRGFAIGIGIPLSHLDLLLWYRETGEIFK